MELEDTVLPGSEIISLLVRRQFNMERCYHPVFLYCFGVPKGSLLRSFVTYINDLPQCLLHSAISMYADGSVIHYTGSNINIIRENLQEDLKRVKQWLMSSRLILNQRKRKETTANLIRLCAADLRFNYLGVMLDEQLLERAYRLPL